MNSGIRIRASARAGLTTVQAVIKHPMHTGNSRDPNSGKIIPAHFIENVTIQHGGKIIMSCDWSRAVSKNPYLSLAFTGASPGDIVRISWRDSHGHTESKDALVAG